MAECSGCGGFCGPEELYLADMKVSRADGAAVEMFRSWRCAIRYAITQHGLSSESRPVAKCTECGRRGAGMRDGAFCIVPVGENEHTHATVFCEGTMRTRWEDLS